MKLPYLPETKSKTKQQTVAFAGINYSQNTRDGELAECENLSSRNFPCLSQRAGRKTVQTYTSPTAMFVKDKLLVVDGTSLLYNGANIGTVTAGEKQIVSINTKVVILPDKKVLDTTDNSLSSMDATYTVMAGDATFSAGTEASEYDFLVLPSGYFARVGDLDVYETTPSTIFTVYNEKNVKVNSNTGVLTLGAGTNKKASALASGDIIQFDDMDKTSQYAKVDVAYGDTETHYIQYYIYDVVQSDYDDLRTYFRVGDAITISGSGLNDGTHVVKIIAKNIMGFAKGTMNAGKTDPGTNMTLERTVPDFDVICEKDNRIWGAAGNTIYVSALGDPFNFNVFEGLSTDSFAVAVGSDGEFTGCIGYGGAVLFFKENCVHKVLGSYPAQYEVYTYQIPGVKKGSEKSLKIINEVLYYKGVNGVYRYTGGTPELITDNFGLRRFSDGVAGTDGQNYYLSVLDGKNAWQLYVYDTLRGIWLREDSTQAIDFALLDGDLVYLDGGSKKLMKLGQDDTEEGRVAWSAEFCKMDETTLGRKGYSKILLRADLDAGAWIRVEISQDDGLFRQIYTGHNEKAKTLVLPILPGRCDNFRIRLSGKGRCMVKSMVREFSVGSEY